MWKFSHIEICKKHSIWEKGEISTGKSYDNLRAANKHSNGFEKIRQKFIEMEITSRLEGKSFTVVTLNAQCNMCCVENSFNYGNQLVVAEKQNLYVSSVLMKNLRRKFKKKQVLTIFCDHSIKMSLQIHCFKIFRWWIFHILSHTCCNSFQYIVHVKLFQLIIYYNLLFFAHSETPPYLTNN